MRKKKLFCVILFIILLSHIVFINVYQANPTAEYIYDNTGSIVAIKFKNQIYESMPDDPPKPYDFIYDEYSLEYRSYLVMYDELTDFFFMWDRVRFYSDYYDKDKNFVRGSVLGDASDDFYVKEGFIYPTLDKNQVDEIWMSVRRNEARQGTVLCLD